MNNVHSFIILTIVFLSSNLQSQDRWQFNLVDLRDIDTRRPSSCPMSENLKAKIVLIYRDDNYSAHRKLFLDAIKEHNNKEIKSVTVKKGTSNIIAITKKSSTCKSSREYKNSRVLEFYPGKNLDEIKATLKRQEELYKSYGLKFEILEVLDCDEIIKKADESGNAIYLYRN